MIDKKEILEKAGEYSLEPRVIEKDYILGWLLAGISNHKDRRGYNCYSRLGHFVETKYS